jgi:predicted Zn-dependent protease
MNSPELAKNSMRKLVSSIMCFGAVLLLGYLGFRSYRTWKQKHLIRMARQFAAASDLRSAQLSLSELLQANPANVEASRLMAEFAPADQLPTIFMWRKRVVDLDPQSSKDRLALAELAVKMGDLPAAADALKGIQAADKNTADYHDVAGSWHAAANQLHAAEADFREAIRLDPGNPARELSLAVLCLHDTNAVGMTEARTTLSRLSANLTNSTLRGQALRELAIDAVHHNQKEASLDFTGRLLQETNALFSDRLLRLEALWETQDPRFKQELASLQVKAQTDSANIEEMMMWQLGKIPPDESLSWLQTLPESTQTNRPVAQLEAECFVALQDWTGLEACVEKGNWGELEPVRHAFKARALRGQGLDTATRGEWKQAMLAANGQESMQVMLLRLTAQWTWLSEGEEILRTIVSEHPDAEWARRALGEALFASGQTRSLMQLYSQQATRDPSDLAAKNTVAITALLLDAQEMRPEEIALELYRDFPTNSSFAATYAFSLYRQGKNSEARQVLERLDPQQLESAPVAPCYGLLLVANGNRTKAKKYLDLASKLQMLPEERKLIDSAKSDLDQAATPKS